MEGLDKNDLKIVGLFERDMYYAGHTISKLLIRDDTYTRYVGALGIPRDTFRRIKTDVQPHLKRDLTVIPYLAFHNHLPPEEFDQVRVVLLDDILPVLWNGINIYRKFSRNSILREIEDPSQDEAFLRCMVDALDLPRGKDDRKAAIEFLTMYGGQRDIRMLAERLERAAYYRERDIAQRRFASWD